MLALGSSGVRLRILGRTRCGSNSDMAAMRMNSGLKDSWDRNRTCTLRFWRPLPYVQQRSGAYTSRLEMAYFDGPKYQEVHQSWGQHWGQTPATRHSKIAARGHRSTSCVLVADTLQATCHRLESAWSMMRSSPAYHVLPTRQGSARTRQQG
jgi:hypothetical protein